MMPGRILVADDNRSLVEVLQMDFELRGHKVLTAFDGEEAETAVKEHQPELIILDVMMPKKNGYTVCRDLKKDPELAKIPVILLTAKNTGDDISWGYDCGADAYVTKPYEPRELTDLVERLLKESKEGKRTISWTGLYDASVVEKEALLRLDAGGEGVLLSLDFDEEERSVFKQKYGTAKMRDLIHTLAWKLHNVFQEISPTIMLGQYANDTFLLLVHPTEEERATNAAGHIFKEIIIPAYDTRDLSRNGIERIDPKTGNKDVVPIMSLKFSRKNI